MRLITTCMSRLERSKRRLSSIYSIDRVAQGTWSMFSRPRGVRGTDQHAIVICRARTMKDQEHGRQPDSKSIHGEMKGIRYFL